MRKGKFKKYRGKTTRLQHWDYSAPGFYYVTMCTKDRIYYFGDVVLNGGDPVMDYSEVGKIAVQYWLDIPNHFSNIQSDVFQVMPNHIHGIIEIEENSRCDAIYRVATGPNKFGPLPPKSLQSIMNSYKAAVTRWANQNNLQFQWQSRFYEHIIRDEQDYNRICEYIKNNPANWYWDRNCPDSKWDD